ncbi:MAG TPA: ferredoxin reductase family protein [Frankiaceae bacterium]|jgi:predicted ferric reductase|nr:ferredoxin reductase family protein [Frankiaceae bacterium]
MESVLTPAAPVDSRPSQRALLPGHQPSALPPAPAPVRADPGVALALIAAGAVATIGLWWLNTPYVSGFGDWLTSAGRITGLLAGYSVVVLVALMSRLPPLENGLGADRLARWHSMGGRYTVCLIVAHGLLITWGYAVTAHTNVVHQGWTLLRSYPDVLAGSVAGLLFVGVGVSSMRAARRKLAYETWYYLHFYTYLAIALAFSHQFANGAEFMTNQAARIFWAVLYIAVFGALLWYRILLPIVKNSRHQLRVVSVVAESPNALSVLVTGEHLDELAAQPGQFFRWRFLTKGMWWASNPYSLSAPADPRMMRFTVKYLGDHSRALRRLKPGTRVFAEGPYGTFTGQRRTQRRVLLIAAGVGITPLRALYESIWAWPGDLALIYRESDAREVLFRRELESIASTRQAKLDIIVGSRGQLGFDPLAAHSLARIPGLAENDIYVCGPDAMEQSVISALRSLGVPRRQIHTESFTF